MKGGSVNDLRPQSSRNLNKPSGDLLKYEIEQRIKEGKLAESEASEDYGLEESVESFHGIGIGGAGDEPDEHRLQTLINFGYPEDYVRYCLAENEANYCMATYFLLGED